MPRARSKRSLEVFFPSRPSRASKGFRSPMGEKGRSTSSVIIWEETHVGTR